MSGKNDKSKTKTIKVFRTAVNKATPVHLQWERNRDCNWPTANIDSLISVLFPYFHRKQCQKAWNHGVLKLMPGFLELKYSPYNILLWFYLLYPLFFSVFYLLYLLKAFILYSLHWKLTLQFFNEKVLQTVVLKFDSACTIKGSFNCFLGVVSPVAVPSLGGLRPMWVRVAVHMAHVAAPLPPTWETWIVPMSQARGEWTRG